MRNTYEQWKKESDNFGVGEHISYETWLERKLYDSIPEQKVRVAINNLWIKHPATESHKGHNGALLELKKELGL